MRAVKIAMIRAHRLAQEIEMIHAKHVASEVRHGHTWRDFYDPHAATELGDLIYRRISCPTDNSEPRQSK